MKTTLFEYRVSRDSSQVQAVFEFFEVKTQNFGAYILQKIFSLQNMQRLCVTERFYQTSCKVNKISQRASSDQSQTITYIHNGGNLCHATYLWVRLRASSFILFVKLNKKFSQELNH